MSRNLAPHRRVAFFVGVLVAAQLAASHAQSTAPAPSKRLSRSEHLQEWLAALERHEPGRADDALGVFDTWRPDDFQYLAIDLNTLLSVIADPSIRTFFYRAERRSASRQVVYSGSDLRLIVELANAARDRRGDHVLQPAERLQRNRNHILKRAAILHTDMAIEVLLGGASRRRKAPLGFQSYTLLMPDGRSQGLAVDVGHWEFARVILDKVAPAPARDEFVRGWYRATAGYLHSLGQLVPSHFTRGLTLFPEDGELLFQAASLHESLAQTRVQEAFQSAAVPTDIKFEVSSRRAELREAESLFRKALKARPDDIEARIHLGRVLGHRGDHAEAEAELRQAVGEAKEPLLQYYAQLFLGAEREALGDRHQARDLYARASTLYPDAQSPRLALSLLASGDGNHRDALQAMSAVLGLSGDTRIDPWWNYHLSPGRNGTTDLANLYAAFLDEDRR
jgi:tetratricopeptide (TPR) repeat protein